MKGLFEGMAKAGMKTGERMRAGKKITLTKLKKRKQVKMAKKQYYKSVKNMSKPVTSGQAKFAGGIHKLVTTFLKTKPPKRR